MNKTRLHPGRVPIRRKKDFFEDSYSKKKTSNVTLPMFFGVKAIKKGSQVRGAPQQSHIGYFLVLHFLILLSFSMYLSIFGGIN